MRRDRWVLFLLLTASALLATPGMATGQSAATVAATDPVYDDLRRLEALGLAPRGAGASGPWSVARIAWIVQEARAVAGEQDLPEPRRSDVAALLTRLAGRFPSDAPQRMMAALEMEAGGGRSPDRFAPDNGLGRRDAVVNPLWMGRGGRTYGDRSTGTLGGNLTVPLGSVLALSAGGSRTWRRSSGDMSPGEPSALESLSLRARMRGVFLEVGRGRVWTGDGGPRELVLSSNGPALDMIRFGTDRPLLLHVLGDLDVTLFVADLGETQVPAHAKLFGVVATARPTSVLEVGLTVLNKQLGEGAPDASLSDRLRDLTLVLDWFRPGVSDFSNKLAAASVRLRPAGGAALLLGEAILTDFDHRRLRHTFQSTAGYRLGVEFPRLGNTGRHSLRMEAAWLGPDLYLHHQYRSGHAAGGFPMGSYLGPDTRSARVAYAFHPSARYWWGSLGLAADDWRGDTWGRGAVGEDGLRRLVDGPDEVRVRGDVALHRTRRDGLAGMNIALGLERVRNFGFERGDHRVHGALSLRFWHAFQYAF